MHACVSTPFPLHFWLVPGVPVPQLGLLPDYHMLEAFSPFPEAEHRGGAAWGGGSRQAGFPAGLGLLPAVDPSRRWIKGEPVGSGDGDGDGSQTVSWDFSSPNLHPRQLWRTQLENSLFTSVLSSHRCGVTCRELAAGRTCVSRCPVRDSGPHPRTLFIRP